MCSTSSRNDSLVFRILSVPVSSREIVSSRWINWLSRSVSSSIRASANSDPQSVVLALNVLGLAVETLGQKSVDPTVVTNVAGAAHVLNPRKNHPPADFPSRRIKHEAADVLCALQLVQIRSGSLSS